MAAALTREPGIVGGIGTGLMLFEPDQTNAYVAGGGHNDQRSARGCFPHMIHAEAEEWHPCLPDKGVKS